MRAIVLIVAALLSPGTLRAQEPLPQPVTAGLDSLQRGQCEAAFRIWSASWTVSPDGAAKRQSLIGGCSILTGLGSFNGYDIIHVVPVGTNLLRVYSLLKYQHQPVYLLLVAYRPAKAWKVISVNWHTNSENVFPPDLLPPEKPKP